MIRFIGLALILIGFGIFGSVFSASADADACVGAPGSATCANAGKDCTTGEAVENSKCRLPYAADPTGGAGCKLEYNGCFELPPTEEYPSGKFVHFWKCVADGASCTGTMRQSPVFSACLDVEPPVVPLPYAHPKECLNETGPTTITLSQTKKSCQGDFSMNTGTAEEPGIGGQNTDDVDCSCKGNLDENNPDPCEYPVCSCMDC